MSIFQTPRPTDVDSALNKLVGMKRQRKNNIIALEQAAVANQEAEKTKKEMDNMDAQDEKKKNSDKALEALQLRRETQLKNQMLTTLESRMLKEQVPELFNQIIFEMAYNAYWMDDDVKAKADIHAMYESFNHIKNMVSEIATEGTSLFLDNAKSVVEAACKKRCAEIASDFKENKKCCSLSDMDEIDFSLSDDDNIKLDDDLVDLGKEEIEQMVKDKVLAVVQDEKRSSDEKAQAFKDVEDAMNELDKPAEGEEPAPEENGTTTESISPLAMIQARNLRKKLTTMTENMSVFSAAMMHANKSLQEEIATEGVQVSKEAMATAVFTDAVFTYTVLETFNTTGLYKFTSSTTRELVKKLQTM